MSVLAVTLGGISLGCIHVRGCCTWPFIRLGLGGTYHTAGLRVANVYKVAWPQPDGHASCENVQAGSIMNFKVVLRGIEGIITGREDH